MSNKKKTPETDSDKDSSQVKEKDVEKDDSWTHSESEYKYESRKDHDNGSRYSWGVFFIFIGLIFLFNTTGILPWDVWGYLWRFWPLIFVLVGLSIIFDRSRWFGWIALVISILMFGSLLLFLLATYNTKLFEDAGLKIPNWVEDLAKNVDDISDNKGDKLENSEVYDKEDYQEVEELDLQIEIGKSEFEITDSRNKDYLLMIDSLYFENFGIPDIRDDVDNNLLTVEFEQKNKTPIGGFDDDNPFYSFQLGDDQVSTDISIDLGAGKGTIDLDNTSLSKLTGGIGAGELNVTLGGEGIDGSKLTFDIGAGKVKLDLDKYVGYEISYDVGIGSLNIEGIQDGQIGGEGTLRSKNFDEVDVKVEIDLNVGVGSFELN